MARMNVLVYAGGGTTKESVRHTLYSLRRLLSPHFAVASITAEILIEEPWTTSCALLVLPGGADLGYCRALDGKGNTKIAQFVRRGGAYLGLCAGGYYGSGQVEFEVGNGALEVVGSRELRFFPGICRGGAFSGFQYASESGAKAPYLSIEKSAFEGEDIPRAFRSYYNGGGVFVDAEKYKEKGVEILARFTEKLAVDAGEGNAAIVYCKIGDGGVILTSPHPEFAAVNLDKNAGDEDYTKIIEAIAEDDEKRVKFLKACLVKLGLRISESNNTEPTLSNLHLSSLDPEDVLHLTERLEEITTIGGGIKKIVGENDTFVLGNPSDPLLSLETQSGASRGEGEGPSDKIIDYDKVEKHIQIHDKGYPSNSYTPYWNHKMYYESLNYYRSLSRSSPEQFGSFLLYGEVVTSTNTMLEKNFNLLQRLPNGLVAVATLQIAARGRGSNVWVSPHGALPFSICLRHPQELSVQAPVIFVQYLVAIAVVEGIKSYNPGYNDMPVRLKWPNDIYAEDPSAPENSSREDERKFVKIGGILVNSSYANDQFLLVVGCGINTTNPAPTTSLNILLEALNMRRKNKGLGLLPSFEHEKLLARILVVFEEMYYKFCLLGFRQFEELYYKHWLHSNQIVRLEMEGGTKARIRGITMDHGLLKADELGRDDAQTGRVFTLQSDNNSFDFFKGLLRKKV